MEGDFKFTERDYHSLISRSNVWNLKWHTVITVGGPHGTSQGTHQQRPFSTRNYQLHSNPFIMRGLPPFIRGAENIRPCCTPKPILSWNNQYDKEIKLNFTCSLVNHRASSISFLSTLISVDTATAKQPIINEEGIGHGWQETYWTWPTLTPLSSSTSLRTASSIVSPNQRKHKNTWRHQHQRLRHSELRTVQTFWNHSGKDPHSMAAHSRKGLKKSISFASVWPQLQD